MITVLLIDDDIPFCKVLEKFLVRKGFQIETSYSGEEAKKKIKSKKIDLIMTDLRLPDYDGIELMLEIKKELPFVPILLMTSYSDVNTAVKALKNGASDYISKPFNPDEVVLVIENMLQKNQNDSSSKEFSENKIKKTELKKGFVTGISNASKKLNEYIELVSPTDMSVLITGQSGTGKEVIAKSIHDKSLRKNFSFIAVDCGAIPKDLASSEFFGHIKGSFTGALSDKMGVFEAANGGTIFLDEIGNLSYENQIQLLRAIQERKVKRIGSNVEIEVDIRILSATNEDLREAVNNGEFREDLFHRLNEFSILSPSLKERDEDLMIFADYFLEKSNAQLHKNCIGFSKEVITVFEKYNWPGNIRELQNVIKRATLLSKNDFIEINSLPLEIIQNESRIVNRFSLPENEKSVIVDALIQSNDNKSKAAELLNISRKTLYNKMKFYNIK